MSIPIDFRKMFYDISLLQSNYFTKYDYLKDRGTWIQSDFSHFGFVVKQHSCHVELCFQEKSPDISNQKFDQIFMHRIIIENKLNLNLIWERMDTNNRSKIMTNPVGHGYKDYDIWESIIIHLLNDFKKFYDEISLYTT
jgi:hypothetical protein